MKKKTYNLQITAVLPDGAVIHNDEWFANRQVFPCEKNKSVLDEYARQSDPNFRAMERAKRRFELTAKRKQELEAQQAKIQSELAQL